MKNIFILCFFVFIGGCATTQPQLSPMQIRNITMKQFDGSFENIYRSAITVLQDQGYIIKNTDMASGLIVANIDKEASKDSQFFQSFWLGEIRNKGSMIEVSAMVDRINDTLSEIRLNIQEASYDESNAKRNIKRIYEHETYHNLFSQIATEIKRREARYS